MTAGSDTRRQYAHRRARQIAYGRWDPWADPAPVIAHVRELRHTGASYQAIARAAGVSTMTVHRLHNDGQPDGPAARRRVRAVQARQLLAITPAAVARASARRDATGTRRRLHALIAMGHPAMSLARCLEITPRRVRDIVGGTTPTVTPQMREAVRDLYDQMWDRRSAECTAAQRRAAAAARARAARNGWPPPMGLDDDQIDDPAYCPRTRWRPADGIGTVPPSRQLTTSGPSPGAGDGQHIEAAS